MPLPGLNASSMAGLAAGDGGGAPQVVATATTTAYNPYWDGDDHYLAHINIPAYEAGDLSLVVLAAHGDGDDLMFELFTWLIGGGLPGAWLPGGIVDAEGGPGSVLEGAILFNERESSGSAHTIVIPLQSQGGTSGRVYAHAFTIRGHRPFGEEELSPILGNEDHDQLNSLYTTDNTPTAWRISGPHVSQGLPSLAMTVAFHMNDASDPASHFINSDASGYEWLYSSSTSGLDATLWTAWQVIEDAFDWGDWSTGATSNYLVWSFVIAPEGLDDQYHGLQFEGP